MAVSPGQVCICLKGPVFLFSHWPDQLVCLNNNFFYMFIIIYYILEWYVCTTYYLGVKAVHNICCPSVSRTQQEHSISWECLCLCSYLN
jgi:hypothetical protein